MSARRASDSSGWRRPGALLASILLLAIALSSAGCERLELRPQTATAPPLESPPPGLTETPTIEPTSTPTVESTPLPVDPAFTALGQQMAVAIEDYWVNGNYAVAVTDLQTGAIVGANIDRPQLSGCIMNLYILLVALRDVDAGAYDLDMVDPLIRATVWSSNAETAHRLYEIAGLGDATVGVRKVAALHRELGYELTLIDHPPAFGDDTVGVDSDNWVTAREVNAALAALYSGELLSPRLTAYLLDVMVDVKPGLNYLAAYGNGGITSHKNGFFPYSGGYVDNDAGIVRFERGGQEYAYAVTFLSDGVPTRYGDIVLGQALMAMAWSYFEAAYPAP